MTLTYTEICRLTDCQPFHILGPECHVDEFSAMCILDPRRFPVALRFKQSPNQCGSSAKFEPVLSLIHKAFFNTRRIFNISSFEPGGFRPRDLTTRPPQPHIGESVQEAIA
ncbi:hypothetical protein AVEN_254777-1 [Araneus ventricosus]|uniref:Uncharacterized protein n=1 Tax=Araneus ventricosus TaxID=182803 RepID=A0A4Y2GCU2_ARAVE|nr:hypothetical protein AVEN_254777-1 [Araneus ventricosus]